MSLDRTGHRRLSGGRLHSAGYDARTQRLEIVFSDHSARVYKGVPDEVWRRLLSAPSAGSYFDDRIAEEYPKGFHPSDAMPEDPSLLISVAAAIHRKGGNPNYRTLGNLRSPARETERTVRRRGSAHRTGA